MKMVEFNIHSILRAQQGRPPVRPGKIRLRAGA